VFEKVSRAAEQVAAGVSRRRFLGRVGRWAAAVAGALAGVAVLADTAQAGGPRLCSVWSEAECANQKHGSPCLLLGGIMGKCGNLKPRRNGPDGNMVCGCQGKLPPLP
jgi:hypothetical protein